MTKRILIGLAFVGLAALAVTIWRFNAADGGLPLSGPTRADFVKSALDGCLATQKAAPRSGEVAAGAIERFCGCYAEDLAGRVSTADLDRLTGKSAAAIQAEMREKTQAADQTCAARSGDGAK